MITKEKIYNLLQKDGLVYKKPSNLFCFMANYFSCSEEEVKNEFAKLQKNGDIFEEKKSKWVTIPSKNYQKGLFIGNAKGFGFCQLGGVKGESDIFIPANKTCGAIDGDRVIIKINYQGSEGSEGEVVSIYKPVEQVVGIVEKIGANFFLEPDNNHIPFKIRLTKSDIKIEDNTRVVAKLARGKVITGTVIEMLGKSDDVKAMELGIIRDHNLQSVFPPDVMEECDKIPFVVLASQKKNRVDLTKEVIFTIDGEDAQDFDDAVSIEKNGKFYTLGVHIADVGEYVKYNTALDEEAYNRGTSVYFPTSVLPMLPEKLSNGICSLNEGVERLTLTCEMRVDEEGNVVEHKIYESVIKSVARLTYTEVAKVLNGEKAIEKAEKVKNELLLMRELSKILQNKKKIKGYLDFEIPEAQFIFDENGLAIGVEKRERNDAHRLIEDFMVLANETVAKHFCDKGIPFVYRVHEKPRKEKLDKALDFIKGLGLNVPPVPSEIEPEYYQKLLALIDGHDYTETVNKVLLRSMQKARYTNKNLGHFGLALEYYCHFTSPIRRYPDLTIHRIIKECLRKKSISPARKEELESLTFESGEQSSLTERNAELAEREVDDLWKAYLMKDHIGETFEGVITSVTNYGLFVQLENTVEGLLRIEDLPQDDYLFFEKTLKLKGTRFVFSIGDKINVILANANIFTRKVDFSYKN